MSKFIINPVTGKIDYVDSESEIEYYDDRYLMLDQTTPQTIDTGDSSFQITEYSGSLLGTIPLSSPLILGTGTYNGGELPILSVGGRFAIYDTIGDDVTDLAFINHDLSKMFLLSASFDNDAIGCSVSFSAEGNLTINNNNVSNPYFYQSGTIAESTSIVSFQLEDTDDFYELSKVSGDVVGFKVSMPLNISDSSTTASQLNIHDTDAYSTYPEARIGFWTKYDTAETEIEGARIAGYKFNDTDGSNAYSLGFFTKEHTGTLTEQLTIDPWGDVDLYANDLTTTGGLSAASLNLASNNSLFFNDIPVITIDTVLGNSFFGLNSGNTTMTGAMNTGVGTNALLNNTTGEWNFGIGANSLSQNTTGSWNTAIGKQALNDNTTGNGNVGLGDNTLGGNVSGGFNTAVGGYALFDMTNKSNNTAIGAEAGRYSLGSNNTFIGINSDLASPYNFDNSTAIGTHAIVGKSNAIVLGGTGDYAVDVGIGTSTPDATLHVVGDAKIGSANSYWEISEADLTGSGFGYVPLLAPTGSVLGSFGVFGATTIMQKAYTGATSVNYVLGTSDEDNQCSIEFTPSTDTLWIDSSLQIYDTDVKDRAINFTIGDTDIETNPYFRHYGTNTAGSSVDYYQWQVDSTTGAYRLTGDNTNYRELDVDMPIEQIITISSGDGSKAIYQSVTFNNDEAAEGISNTLHYAYMSRQGTIDQYTGAYGETNQDLLYWLVNGATYAGSYDVALNNYGITGIVADQGAFNADGHTMTVKNYALYANVNASRSLTAGTLNVENYGNYIVVSNSANPSAQISYGIYIAGVGENGSNYGIWDASTRDWVLDADNQAIIFGADQDASIEFDGTNLLVTGSLDVSGSAISTSITLGDGTSTEQAIIYVDDGTADPNKDRIVFNPDFFASGWGGWQWTRNTGKSAISAYSGDDSAALTARSYALDKDIIIALLNSTDFEDGDSWVLTKDTDNTNNLIFSNYNYGTEAYIAPLKLETDGGVQLCGDSTYVKFEPALNPATMLTGTFTKISSYANSGGDNIIYSDAPLLLENTRSTYYDWDGDGSVMVSGGFFDVVTSNGDPAASADETYANIAMGAKHTRTGTINDYVTDQTEINFSHFFGANNNAEYSGSNSGLLIGDVGAYSNVVSNLTYNSNGNTATRLAAGVIADVVITDTETDGTLNHFIIGYGLNIDASGITKTNGVTYLFGINIGDLLAPAGSVIYAIHDSSGANWLLGNTDQYIEFNDSDTKIGSDDDGHLDLFADTSIDLNGTTKVINGTGNATLRIHCVDGGDEAELIYGAGADETEYFRSVYKPSSGILEREWVDSGGIDILHKTYKSGAQDFIQASDISSGSFFYIINSSDNGFTASSGTQSFWYFSPKITQTDTAGYSAIKVDVTEVSTGSGDKRLLDLQNGGNEKFYVRNDGNIFIRTDDDTSIETNFLNMDLSAYVEGLEVTLPIISGNAYSSMPETLPFDYALGVYDRLGIFDKSDTGLVEISFSKLNFLDGSGIIGANLDEGYFYANWDWCPDEDDSYSLGSSSLQWQNLYLSGDAIIAGATKSGSGFIDTRTTNDVDLPILTAGNDTKDGIFWQDPSAPVGNYFTFKINNASYLRVDGAGGGIVFDKPFSVLAGGAITNSVSFSNIANDELRITANVVEIGGGSAGVDYILRFNGQDNDLTLTYMEDEDYLKTSSPFRAATSLYRRYYHLSTNAFDPGASGATWTAPSANTTGGYRLDAASEILYFDADVHSDWDGASDMKVELYFAVNVDNTGGGVDDTVDLKLIAYYNTIGDTATKSQTVEVATTVGQSAQYKVFKATFTLDYDATDNVIEAGDLIGFALNLETDSSEVDDIVLLHGNFYYNTTHIGTESGDV